MILNLLFNDEAVNFLKGMEAKAQSENLEVKGYIAGPDWEWSSKYCEDIDTSVVMIVNDRIAEAVVRKHKDGEYPVMHIQIDQHSGKTHTTNYCIETRFSEAITRFSVEVYNMIR